MPGAAMHGRATSGTVGLCGARNFLTEANEISWPGRAGPGGAGRCREWHGDVGQCAATCGEGLFSWPGTVWRRGAMRCMERRGHLTAEFVAGLG